MNNVITFTAKQQKETPTHADLDGYVWECECENCSFYLSDTGIIACWECDKPAGSWTPVK